MKTTRWIFLGLALAVSACSYRLFLDVSGPLEAPVISVNAPGFAGRDCLTRFSVATAAEPIATLWAGASIDGSCVGLAEITYGVVPEGFVAMNPAPPLNAGILYQATAFRPGSGGQVDIVFLEGRWREAH